MTAQQIRKAFFDYAIKNGHIIIPRANLVPQNDPTTLFTGSGMQPIVPYLLGETHPAGTRIADSQTCFRAEDIDEVGDNRHTTFFEMLGNWSFGDYFKQEQINWFWEFLTDKVSIDPNRLFVTCYIGNKEANIPKDNESAKIWADLFKAAGVDTKQVDIGSEQNGYKVGDQGGRIFFYDDKNWWSRAGSPSKMPKGEPGGPSSEVFYEFTQVQHNPKFGKKCHPNCDCGRFMEIGNSVFMLYLKKANGSFGKLPKANVDFGGGLERIAAANIDSPDMYKISLLWPVIERLQNISGKKYEQNTTSMRVITDHLRAATFLAVDGVVPSNKAQGYVMRRFLRRAIRYAFDLGVEQNFMQDIVPIIADLYHKDYPEVAENRQKIIDVLIREEKIFRQTLRAGVREFGKLTTNGKLSGQDIFKLYDTYGFPVELTKEEAFKQNITITGDADAEFDKLMSEQKSRSQTAAKGIFKGGLADHSEITTKYHTATHLMYRALRMVLGGHVVQRGSNITGERLRFDFSHDSKMTPEQIGQVEDIVNQQIDKDWPVSYREENTKHVLESGVMGAFGDKYGEVVKVYTVGDPDGENYSREICGGPHVTNTGKLAEGNKRFKIKKEEASSAGVRRIKAILV